MADVAQLVEQSIRNRQVIGSSPIVGSIVFCRFAPARSSLFLTAKRSRTCGTAARRVVGLAAIPVITRDYGDPF
jgi:hypothetical protein